MFYILKSAYLYRSRVFFFLIIIFLLQLYLKYNGCPKTTVSRACTVQQVLSSSLETKQASRVLHYLSKEMLTLLGAIFPELQQFLVPKFPLPLAHLQKKSKIVSKNVLKFLFIRIVIKILFFEVLDAIMHSFTLFFRNCFAKFFQWQPTHKRVYGIGHVLLCLKLFIM